MRVFNAHAFVAKFHRVHYAQPFAADASETVNDFHRASGIFFHKLGCRDTSGVETAAHARRKRDMQNVVARFHVRFKRFKSDFSVGLTRLGNRPRAKCVKELFHVLNKARRVGAAFHNIELRVRLPDKVEFFSVPFGIFKEYGIGTMGISCSFSYPTGMSAHASVLIT